MTNKTDKQFFFETSVNWLAADRGILHAHDVNETIHVTTPAVFGGPGKEWSPEHLFLGAVISCYMSTFMSISKKMGFAVGHFECNAISQVELVEGKFRFTNINLYPKIIIAVESLRQKAGLAAQKTQQYCLVANSINATIIHHTEILVETHATAKIKKAVSL